MREVTPEVYLISKPQVIGEEMYKYLSEVDGLSWMAKVPSPFKDSLAQSIIEFAGRLCYRSWKPGLNPNVRKVRKDGYLYHILESGHGSVLEHANFGLVFHNVSRVFTHELVRHRAGSAFSQESMRFVRLTDIPMWLPEWAKNDRYLTGRVEWLVKQLEDFQIEMTDHFRLNDPDINFNEKKAKTSFMRRFAPEGVATSIMWTANVRTLRHVIEARTAPGAEEEIRMVFGEVARIMSTECPELFGDFVRGDEGAWVTKFSKV